jgi:hypothetical protein
MSRRKHFKGICHDILQNFTSRNNDFDGYWAPGQYVSLLNRIGERQIQFDLKNSMVVPDGTGFTSSASFYRAAIYRLMEAHAMPQAWFADAAIKLSIIASAKAACEIEIVSDLGRIYRSNIIIDVRPHDPLLEMRRAGGFGPQIQKVTTSN